MEEKRVETVLINQPYYIKRIDVGNIVAWHNIELLSDWSLFSPYGCFNPDKIFLLDKMGKKMMEFSL